MSAGTRSRLVFTLACLAILWLTACAPSDEAPVAARREAIRSARDGFGVRMIYPSAGRSWEADFRSARTLRPGDAFGDLWNRGSGTLRIVGDGTAIATGDVQRHYIGDRSEARQWRNLELTYYARRLDDFTRDELLSESPRSRAGITAEVRTGDGHSSSYSAAQRCDAHAYAGTFRFYGHAAFAKELQHPNYASSADPAGGSVRTNLWPSGVPLDRWIGFKLVVFNQPGGVRLELYRDLTNGRGGGTWQRVLTYRDRPGRWGIPGTPTLCGMPTDRIISESGPFAIVRNEITEVQYKRMSLREIDAAPVAGSAFVDIGDSLFAADVTWLEARGDAVPCNPPWNNWFCPDDEVRRNEAAAFFARALGLSPPGGDRFVDDDTDPFEDDIEAIAECGISRGCNPPTNDRFCPNRAITRGQMAAFFDRAFTLPATTRNYFTDDEGSIFEAAIDRIAAAGITRGCNPPTNDRFCPDAPVTRGQMSAFLHRALTSVTPTRACVCTSTTEVCNALDDDCDGLVDENASAEVCNGLDDDCDGDVDENASAEVCNGRDDNCDGVIDEPQPESCNGLDDDCDGLVDEGVLDGACRAIDGGLDAGEDASAGDGGGGGGDASVVPDANIAADGSAVTDAGWDVPGADTGSGSGPVVGGCGCGTIGGDRGTTTPSLLALLALLALAGLLFRPRRRAL